MSPASADKVDSPPRRLADSLALVLPALPPELVRPAAIPWLTSVASVLPPFHRAGFECRLTADEPDVDLQLGITATDGEPARLARFLTEARPLNDAWQRVRRLAQRWSTMDDPLHEGIAELWLELDAPSAHPVESLALNGVSPSVFAALKGTNGEAPLAIARAFLETLLGESDSAELDDALLRCAQACVDPAQISHVGVMLGRATPSMRVHLSPIPLRELSSHLARVGWRGDRQQVHRLATTLLDYGDLLVLCLDVVHDRVARLGLECFFSQKQGLDPRWEPLLDQLTSLGLSSVEKAQALVRWPGVITPMDGLEPWPEDLILQSLTRSEDVLGVFDRRLSHVKLTLAPNLPVTAKAYFGFGHVWTSFRPSADEPRHRPNCRPASTARDAIEAAVEWLLQMRNQAGWWRDFFGTPNVDFSDEWVTAYIADALAGAPLGAALAAARESLELLLRRRDGAAGWGYHLLLPPDGDATTWVLRLARSLAVPEGVQLAAGRRLLETLTSLDGGVASYTETAAASLARFLGIGGSYAGWCTPHTCISAPAALLGITARTQAHLRASQNADGSWSSYWWQDDEYATAWAVGALAGPAANDDAVKAAMGWCGGRIGPGGAVLSTGHGAPSPFATALALYAIRLGGIRHDQDRWRPAAERAQAWLLAHQLDDGSWEASARMQVPFPSVHDPSESRELIQRYICDDGPFTTATVLAALSAGSRRRK